MTGSNESVAC